MGKNCDNLMVKYKNILINRSKFPFGKRLMKTDDPENFMEFRKLQAKAPNYSLKEKITLLESETKENW
jgi:hypothetical protein